MAAFGGIAEDGSWTCANEDCGKTNNLNHVLKEAEIAEFREELEKNQGPKALCPTCNDINVFLADGRQDSYPSRMRTYHRSSLY